MHSLSRRGTTNGLGYANANCSYIALGVTFLHSLDANVIHRDLKPSNILIDSVHVGTLDLLRISTNPKFSVK